MKEREKEIEGGGTKSTILKMKTIKKIKRRKAASFDRLSKNKRNKIFWSLSVIVGSLFHSFSVCCFKMSKNVLNVQIQNENINCIKTSKIRNEITSFKENFHINKFIHLNRGNNWRSVTVLCQILAINSEPYCRISGTCHVHERRVVKIKSSNI